MTVISPDGGSPRIHGNAPPGRSGAAKPFVLAHLSDPHLAILHPGRKRDLLNKRLLGYLKWRLFRQKVHQEGILSILQEDLQIAGPDHIVVTGDLTHLGLPGEFERARRWLQALGSSGSVTVVPGNHDAYVRSDWNETFARWLEFMASDEPCPSDARISGFEDLFPILRVRGPIALIGICSARPSAPHLAVGAVGELQLRRLETILQRTADQGLFRVLAIHHPPLPGMESRRRSLTDARSLSRLVERCGAELILHGHVHQAVLRRLDTPSGQTLVAGATSASSANPAKQRRACYYLHTLAVSENAWDIHITRRVYCPDALRFVPGEERHFRLASRQA